VPGRPDDVINRIDVVDLHDAASDVIVGCMETDRQVHLARFLGEGVDLRDDAGGADGDVSGSDLQTMRIIDDVDEPHRLVVVVEGFADAHDDDMADPLTDDFLNGEDLLDHLAGRQVALFLLQAGGTEGTADVAAQLRGDADAVAIVVAHQNGLDDVAVIELQQELLSIIG